MQAVILAGGLGTLGARHARPAQGVDSNRGPAVPAWLVESLARNGYRKLVLCIGHHGEQIIDFSGHG